MKSALFLRLGIFSLGYFSLSFASLNIARIDILLLSVSLLISTYIKNVMNSVPQTRVTGRMRLVSLWRHIPTSLGLPELRFHFRVIARLSNPSMEDMF